MKLGTLLSSRYELLGEIGRGGMAAVYRARDRRLGRDVAVKLIPTEGLEDNAVERFQREALLIAALDHPSIVPIYDYGRHEDFEGRWLFFVMPVLPGRTLHQLLRDKALDTDAFLEILLRVAEALDHSAGQKIVHRDIKPENIMVSRAEGRIERVWLMDFGLAVGNETTRLTRTGNLPGTLAYLSPEQVVSSDCDGRSDIYSLGVIAYEFLAGRPPFSGSPATLLYRIVHEEPPALDASREPSLVALVQRCLAKAPADRPSSGRELATTVRGLLRERRGLPQVEPPPVVADPHFVAATELPWVGREREIDELMRRLSAAEGGECQLVAIGGDPGVGKSRLLQEIEILARQRNFQVLQGRFSDPEGSFPYQAFCELIQDYFRQARLGGQRLAPPGFSELAADLIDLFPRLAELPEIAGAVTAGPRSSGGDLAHVYETIARCLALLVAGRSTVLLLEGIHAADASLPLLLFLLRRLNATPSLFVCTYRRTEIGRRHPLQRLVRSLAEDERFLHIVLEKLGKDDHRRLVEVLMDGTPVLADVAARLYDATDGNPLFTVELVRSLNRSGELRTGDSGQLELVDGTGSLGEIPLTLQQALEARLERLPANQELVLQLAAVFARRCELRDLEMLVQSLGETEILANLEELVDALIGEGLLEEERGAQRGDWLRFSSGLVREVAYGRIPRRRRRRLHQKVARALEQRFADRLDRVYAQLIHHWAEADVADRMVAYSVLQVRRLVDGACWEDVTRTVRLAIEFLEVDPEWLEQPEGGSRRVGSGSAEDGPREDHLPELAAVDLKKAEGELRLALARAYRATASFDAALREGERALRAFERVAAGRGEAHREVAEVALMLAEVCWHLRRVPASLAWLEQGLGRAREAGATDVLARLLELLATSANLRGDYAAAADALAELEPLREPSEDAARRLPARRGGRLRVGLRNYLASQDPATAVSVVDAEVLSNIFETLFDVDREGRLVPYLCRQFQLSPDGKTYEFEIEAHHFFSDGTECDAGRIKDSLERSARRGPRRLHSLIEPIVGGLEFLEERAATISGIRVLDPTRLGVELRHAIAFFPAMLSDLRSAICMERENGLLGSGAFRLVSWSAGGADLERNPALPVGRQAYLDTVEIRVFGDSGHLAEAMSRGQLEVGLEMRSTEIEALRRLPEFRSGIHELPQHALGMVLLSPHGEVTRDPRLRRVLTGLIDVRELLWRTIARFVVPAFGLLPPEVLGHQPVREPRRLSRFEAIEILEGLGLRNLRVRALTHGRFAEVFRPLLQAITAEWALVGIDVDVEEVGIDELFRRIEKADDRVDLVFVRFSPDYLDADAYTFDAFHRQAGLFGRLLGSEELDVLCEQGRHERDLQAREALYRRVEDLVIERDLVFPLCRDVAFRVVAPPVHGLGQHSAAVITSYERAYLAEETDRPSALFSPEGLVEVPLVGSFPSIDPVLGYAFDAADVISNVFESLTRVSDTGAIEPLLAETIQVSSDQLRFRFRLRKVRFHDGRLVTTRDVRFSFARFLRARPVDFALFQLPLLGATAYAARESDDLPGLVLINDRELELVIERPSPHFLAMLSHPCLAIVPENTRRFDLSWRDGCAGTGPFRLVACEPGRRVELAAHVGYWQSGLPRIDRLVFQMATDPVARLAGLRSGRFGLSASLLPTDADALSRDPAFVGGLRRHPSYVAGFVAFDAHRGPLADFTTRQAVFRCLEEAADESVAGLGALAVRSRVLIPPGVPASPAPPELRPLGGAERRSDLRGLDLRLGVHDSFAGHYRGVRDRLMRVLQRAGASTTVVAPSSGELLNVLRSGEADLAMILWGAPFPDPEAFAILTDPEVGLVGKWVADPELEQCRARANTELQREERQRHYEEFERILAQKALLLPLFHEQTCWAAGPRVRGLRPRLCWPRVAYAELSVDR